MRTPSLACALFAAAVVVNGAPLPSSGSYNSDVFTNSQPSAESMPTQDNTFGHAHPRIGIKQIRDALPDHQPHAWVDHTIAPRFPPATGLPDFPDGTLGLLTSRPISLADDPFHDFSRGSVTNGDIKSLGVLKRTDDSGTLGGNAYTGNSGDVDGGDVVNEGNNEGMPTLVNMNSNNAGGGGGSESGCAAGGHGNSNRGAGGNAYSGSSGNAEGGSVWNSGGVMNIDSNNAGGAGNTKTGCATGGDVSDNAQ